MDGLLKTVENMDAGDEFSFRKFFAPLTTTKAITWIIIVGVIVYFNVFFNNFVWDDIGFIIANPDIKNLNLYHIFSENMFNSAGYYRPLPALYFSILFNFFGLNAFFYHFFQILLHIINTCLLFYLYRKFIKVPIAFVMSFVFLIHPIQVESVAFIGATQSELLFLFGMTGLILGMKDAHDIKFNSIIFLLFLFSLLTKESGILFLFMFLAYKFLFKKKRLLQTLLFVFLTIIVYFFIRFVIGGIFFQALKIVPIAQLTLAERLINMPAIIFYYLKTLVYPMHLAIDQQWLIKAIDIQHFFFPFLIDVLFFLLIFLAGYFIYKKIKKSFAVYLFFLFWFILSFVMLWQFYPLDMTVADRWFYLPLAGFLGMIGVIVSDVKISNRQSQVVGVLFMVIMLLFSIRTIIRNGNWYTGLTLYGHDVPLEDNYDNESNYAAVLSFDGKYNLALLHAQKSVAIYPYEQNLDNLAASYDELGNLQLAIKYYSQAMLAKSNADYPHKHQIVTYESLSRDQLLSGKLKNAEQSILKGVIDYPKVAELWEALAFIEFKLHHKQASLNAEKKAYTLSPSTKAQNVLNKIQDMQ